MKLNIFWLDCQFNRINPMRPPWFNYEKCFKNLLDTLNPNCRLTIIYDGDFLKSHIQKYISYFPFNIKQIQAGDIFKANTMAFEYIKSLDIPQDDLIMIQENDYLFTYSWVSCIFDLYSLTGGNHYTTLYDHADKYLCAQHRNDEWGIYKELRSQLIVTNTRHWRTVPSTCSSFIINKKIFDEDFDIHTSGEADNSRFGWLSKNRNRVVLSPVPGLSTHVINPWMSPLISWEKINDNTELL